MKRSLSVLLTLSLAVSLLAGCNSGSGNSSAASSETQSADSSEPVSVRWIQHQIEYADPLNKLVDKYMDEHPNVTINLEVNGTNYWETLKSMLAANDVPDIFMTDGYNVMRSYTDYLEDLSDEGFVDVIKEEARQCVDLDGQVVGLPTGFQGNGMIYNKRIFEENNIEIPTTFSEFKSVCEELQSKGITPMINGYKEGYHLGFFLGSIGYAHIPDMEEYNNQRYDGSVTFAGQPELVRCIDFLDYVLEQGKNDPLNVAMSDACTLFAQEQAAMMFQGEWTWGTIKSINPDIQAGMFPVPVSEVAEENKLTVDTNCCWHVGKGGNATEEAKKILNWIALSDSSKEIMENDFQITPAVEGWDYIGDNPFSMAAFEALQESDTYCWPWARWPDGFRDAAGQEFQEYILGNVSKEDLLPELDNIWDKLT